MEAHYLQGDPRFVSDHYLKLVSRLLRHEQIKLDRPFLLARTLTPDKNEPKLFAPALRLPFFLEESQFPSAVAGHHTFRSCTSRFNCANRSKGTEIVNSLQELPAV